MKGVYHYLKTRVQRDSFRRCTQTVWLVLLLILPFVAYASGPQSESWKTITTPHFRVHYHQGVRNIAHDVARMCEDAHATLSPAFEFSPKRRTDVVLIDGSESANGSATTYPRPTIQLFAVPSASFDTRTDTTNWMMEMIVHEYAHILQMEQIQGWIRAINFPLGRLYMPNQGLPRWFLEGSATVFESHYTRAGRMKSRMYRMYMDAALLGDMVPTFAQLNNTPPRFPYGNHWYLTGGAFVQWIAETYGWDALFNAYRAQARLLRPWALNYILWQATGQTGDALYEQWQKEAYAQALSRRQKIEQDGVVEPARLTQKGYDSRWIATSPGLAHPVWLESTGSEDPTLVIPSKTTTEPTRLRVRASGPFDVFPDGRKAVISRGVVQQDGYIRNDLWTVDVRSGKKSRITRGSRASQPRVSPNGQLIAYVRPDDGRYDLYVLNLENGRTQRVVRAKPWTTISQMSWASQGNAIFYSMSKEEGGRDLFVVDLRTSYVQRLTHDASIDDSPYPSPDGRWLYYTSDRDGVFNVYAKNLEDAAPCLDADCTQGDRRITRVRTGVFAPVVHQHEGTCSLWMSFFSSEGYDIATMPLQDDCAPPKALGFADKAYERQGDDPVSTDAVVVIPEPRRYQTGRWARPWSWFPVYGRVGEYQEIGLSTSGQDPAGRFAWRADLSMAFPYRELQWGISTQYRMLRPEFTLSTTRSIYPAMMRVNSRAWPYEQRVTTVGVGTGYRFGGYRATQRVSISYNWENREGLHMPSLQLDPGTEVPSRPMLGLYSGVYLSYTVSNLRSYVRSVSAERGWSATFGIRLRERALGADYPFRSFSFSVKKAIPLTRWDKHVLMLKGDGAFSQSPATKMQVYTLGGQGGQNLWEAIRDQVGAPTRVVRGFPVGVVQAPHYVMLNAEYRFPVLWMDWGHSTIPLFFDRLHGALFMDAALGIDRAFGVEKWLVGFGGELRMDLTASYYLPQEFRLGVARGVGPDGIWQGYVLFGQSF